MCRRTRILFLRLGGGTHEDQAEKWTTNFNVLADDTDCKRSFAGAQDFGRRLPRSLTPPERLNLII